MRTPPSSRRVAVGPPGLVALPLVAALALACTHPIQRRDWSDFEGPGAEHFRAEEVEAPSIPDPFEPLNRSVSVVNHGLVMWVVRPMSSAYRFVVPRFARDRVRDFAANLLWPRNLVANLLQARWRAAGSETARFGINSTLGIAGFFDPAWHWWSIRARPETFGEVFGSWGWQPSRFVMLPLVGPSTIRDGTGLLPDALLDPAFNFFPAGYVLVFNQLSDSVPAYQSFVASRFDPYDDARLLWMLNRDEDIADAPPPTRPQGDDTAAVQTLQAAFLGPRDPLFWTTLRTGEIAMPGHVPGLPYSYRLQPGRATTLFIVPGLGTHRLGSSALAFAELAYGRGFSVVIVSSVFSFEFMQRGASVAVPGHAPIDAQDVHIALDTVAADLERAHPDRVGARAYLGYSLGAFHGFFIASGATDPDRKLVSFERYVLIDPPVRLLEGLEHLDRFFNAPLVFPAEQRSQEVMDILRRTLHFARGTLDPDPTRPDSYPDLMDHGEVDLQPTGELPFTNLEAEFLIGLAFRRTLQSVLWVSQERDDLGVLQTRRSNLWRWAAYQEIADYSFTEYLYGFVLPYYRDRLGLVGSAEELVEANDLHALAEGLHAHPKLRVFANTNDFLTSDADVTWLEDWIGPERVTLLPTGGHLGSLNRPEVQEAIMDSLEDLLGEGR